MHVTRGLTGSLEFAQAALDSLHQIDDRSLSVHVREPNLNVAKSSATKIADHASRRGSCKRCTTLARCEVDTHIVRMRQIALKTNPN